MICPEKNIQYYMSLPYITEVVELPEDQGGGILLCHPEIGRYSATAWGKTYKKARSMLNEIKHDIFQRCLDEDLPIPEPVGLLSPAECFYKRNKTGKLK